MIVSFCFFFSRHRWSGMSVQPSQQWRFMAGHFPPGQIHPVQNCRQPTSQKSAPWSTNHFIPNYNNCVFYNSVLSRQNCTIASPLFLCIVPYGQKLPVWFSWILFRWFSDFNSWAYHLTLSMPKCNPHTGAHLLLAYNRQHSPFT